MKVRTVRRTIARRSTVPPRGGVASGSFGSLFARLSGASTELSKARRRVKRR